MIRSITFEGCSWNCEIGDITEDEFVRQYMNIQYKRYSEHDQRLLLKEAYRLIKLNNRSGGVKATPKIKL